MPIKEKVIEVVSDNRGKIINGLLIVGGVYLAYRFEIGRATWCSSDLKNTLNDLSHAD